MRNPYTGGPELHVLKLYTSTDRSRMAEAWWAGWDREDENAGG